MKKLSLFAAVMLLTPHLYAAQVAHAATNGDLVRCPDISTVYYISQDGKRYSFPNEKIFNTWRNTFDSVQTISCTDLATIPFGGVVKYRSGVRLVKLASAPATYVISPGDVLREIPTEEIAIKFFGPDWAQKVDDLPEGFFSHYTVGEPLTADTLPPGMILKDKSGDIFRISDDGDAIEVDDLLESNDEEDILDDAAEDIDDMETKIHIRIRSLEDLTATDLEALVRELKLKGAEVEVEIEIELHDNEGRTPALRAQHRIDNASEHIARAEEKITQRAADERDVTQAREILAQAKDLLAQAKAHLAASEYDAASEAAHDAKWFADQSRAGQYIEGRPEDILSDDSEVEDEDEDESDDDSNDERAEDEQEDSQDDETEDESEMEDEADHGDDEDETEN